MDDMLMCNVCEEEVFEEDIHADDICVRCWDEWSQEKRMQEKDYLFDLLP